MADLIVENKLREKTKTLENSFKKNVTDAQCNKIDRLIKQFEEGTIFKGETNKEILALLKINIQFHRDIIKEYPQLFKDMYSFVDDMERLKREVSKIE